MATVRIRVVDEHGATARHEFAQDGRDVMDMFPDQFDVGGMKAGRKRPWGGYETTWEVFQRGRRPLRATVAFEWHALQV